MTINRHFTPKALLKTALAVSLLVVLVSCGINTTDTATNESLEIASSAQNEAATGAEITTTSGDAELALAQHLTQVGAKMYGAYWCPHCHAQKEMFGREALSQLNTIECDPAGKNAQPDLCQAANIKGYPTWEINGQFYPGQKSLQELADLSGYEGSRNF